MSVDLTPELQFQTARSGGKGGQNVNKVETAVTASWALDASQLFTPEQKNLIREKLGHRLTAAGLILVKSQTHRSQLANKEEAVRKINALVQKAIEKKKLRIATTVSKAARQRRLDAKKHKSTVKAGRQRFRPDEG